MAKKYQKHAWLPTWYDTDLPIDAALSVVVIGIAVLVLHAFKFF